MTALLAVPSWLAALAALAVLGLVVLIGWAGVTLHRERARTAALLARTAADAEDLRAQLSRIEAELAERDAAPTPVTVPARADDREYLITDLGREDRAPAPIVPAPVFVDILLRESVVRTAGLAAGLRRALSPRAANRIRFEMRREIKRARRQRKADLRTARREFEARQRARIEATG